MSSQSQNQPEHKQPDATFKSELTRGGHCIKITLDKPRILTFETGHPFCYLSSPELEPMVKSIRDRRMAPDRGPYADNKDNGIGKIATEMQKVGRAATGKIDYEEEARWLIDVLLPRATIDEEWNEVVLPIAEERAYRELYFVLNSHPLAGRECKDVMTSGRLIEQEKPTVKGAEYHLALYNEEIATVAAGIMRTPRFGGDGKDGRETYLTMLDTQEPDGKGGVVSVEVPGVAVFTDDHSFISFSNSRSHFSFTGMTIMSDLSAMATMWLRTATTLMRSEIPNMFGAMDHGLVDNEYVDKTIRLIKAKAALAATYYAFHPELDPFAGRLEYERVTAKSEMHKRMVTGALDDLLKAIKMTGIKTGVFGSGIKPADIEQAVKELTDVTAEGYKRYGAVSENMVIAEAALRDFVENQLPKFGYPPKKLPELFRHLEAKLATRLVADVYMRLEEAGRQEWNEMRGKAYEEEIKREVQELTNAIIAKSVSAADATTHLKSLVVRVADGARELGPDNKHMKQANQALAGFVAGMLPHMDFPKESHAEVMRVVMEVLIPATQEQKTEERK